MSDSGEDYEVGYCKPPKHTRYKKGQSGNPNGRPKGARGLKHDLRKVLNEKVTVAENGRQVRVSKQLLVLMQLSSKAIKGDLRAIHRLTELAISQLDDDSEASNVKGCLAPEDEAILQAYIDKNSRDGSNG